MGHDPSTGRWNASGPESASSLMKSAGLKANPSFFGPDQRPIALTRRSTGRSSGHVWPGSNDLGGMPYSVGSGYRTSPTNCDDPVHGSGPGEIASAT